MNDKINKLVKVTFVILPKLNSNSGAKQNIYQVKFEDIRCVDNRKILRY